MNEKTNKWLPWISALLIAVIGTLLLSLMISTLNFPRSALLYVRGIIPSNLLIGIHTIEAINEFSGAETPYNFVKDGRFTVLVSILMIFVVIPYLHFKGTMQSEKKENPTPMWYLGTGLIFMIIVIPLFTVITRVNVIKLTKESAEYSRMQDIMRSELMTVSLDTAEKILELEDISRINELANNSLVEVKNSDFTYNFEPSSADTSITITIVSKKEEGRKNYELSSVVKPYLDQIYELKLY